MITCIKKGQLNNEIANICCYGSGNRQFADKLCAFLFALSPLLQHYKGLYKNAGFTVYLIILPWLMLRLVQALQNGKTSVSKVVTLPLMLFFLYSAVVHGFELSNILHNGFLLVLCLWLEFGCFNIRYIMKYASIICMAASVVLIVQYLCFYIFGFHLCAVPIDALLPESSSWIEGARTGLINIRGGSNGFYRPSAFFLEPSHLFIYCFPVLCMLLFSKNMTKSRIVYALIITLGVILSTSGMGIVCCIGVWACYLLLYYDKSNKNIARWKNLLSVRNMFIITAFIVLVVCMYFAVESVRNTINRILFEGASETFGGRFGQASNLVGNLSGKSLIFGLTGDRDGIIFNLPGFFATMYKKGIIGVLLSYWFYVKGLFRLKNAGFWMTVIILILSFLSAHTHGTFYMMFFVAFLVEEYKK